MSEPIIRVENLSKTYRIGAKEVLPAGALGTVKQMLKSPFRYLASTLREPAPEEMIWALKDVSFEVYPGEVVGIIGRNGAGKSTLLKILSRITKPTSGFAEIRGRVASLLEVGTGFHPELTGRENVYLNGTILGMTKREVDAKFDEIVDFSGIEKFIDTQVKRYSSGMQVRLAFSVAAHLEPEILIVDEVLAVGDFQFQRKCLGKMKDVSQGEGRTVLFVSHNTSAVQNLCKKGILMQQGNLIAQGEVNKILDQYLLTDAEVKPVYSLQVDNSDSMTVFTRRLSIEDQNDNPVSSIPVGQPWKIRVEFQANQYIPNLVIALGLVTDSGLPLRTCWSQPFEVNVGDYQSIFYEDLLILSPGIYSIVIGLSTGDGEILEYIQNAGFIEIADVVKLKDKNINVVKTSGTGIVLNSMRIKNYKMDDIAIPKKS